MVQIVGGFLEGIIIIFDLLKRSSTFTTWGRTDKFETLKNGSLKSLEIIVLECRTLFLIQNNLLHLQTYILNESRSEKPVYIIIFGIFRKSIERFENLTFIILFYNESERAKERF